jgi:hypothetical protein
MPGRLPRRKQKEGKKKTPAFQERVDYYLQRMAVLRNEPDNLPELIQEILPDLEVNPNLAEAFLVQILNRKEEGTALFLSRLRDRVEASALRRRIKGALYQLTQQGLEVPGGEEARKTGPTILKQAESLPLECYLSAFDPLGSRMLTLVVPRVPQGRILVFALVNWDQGLEDLTALEVSKKQVRPLLEETRESAGYPFFPADPNQVVYLLKEAHARTPVLKPEDKKVYSVLMNYLETMGPFTSRPVIRELIPAVEQSKQTTGEWESLKTVPELTAFQLPGNWLSSHTQKLLEIQDSPLVLSPGQQKERLLTVTQQTANEIFTPDRVGNFYRYLEEIVYLYWVKGDAEQARVLLGAVDRLKEVFAGLPVRENPLLTWLIEKEFPEVEGEENAPPPPPETRTEGGLILPHWVKK